MPNNIMFNAIGKESMDSLTIVLTVAGIGLLCAFASLFWSYARGLRKLSARTVDFISHKSNRIYRIRRKNMSFVLYLSADCGLGDISAGSK
jgi:hypothetical protein